MLKRMKALARVAKSGGLAVKQARARALRNQAMLDLAALSEQRRTLEEHFKPRYSAAKYANSLARIDADERRLLARIDRYQSLIDEADAIADRYIHEGSR